ncbi:beta-galactosidase [Thermoflavifilum aggregans]|nr:beta-galactosidase [Thermoflavifilum aggregans]
MYQGKPAIWINDEPVYPMIYALPDVPGGRWAWYEIPRHTIQTFCEQGIRIYQVDIFFDQLWRKDGTFSIDTLKRQIRGVLSVCPKAAIMLRFHVNAPKWWITEHPGENTLYADIKPQPDYSWGIQRIIEDDVEEPTRPSLASDLWKKEAGDRLKQMLHLLARTPEGNSLIGIQIACGVYGEWHYWGFNNHEPDTSKPMKIYFQNWLRNKYHDVKNLRFAWHDPHIDFDQVTVPGLYERKHTTAGIFRDPQQEQKIIDYYEAQHQVVADDILYFCKIVKDNWPRPIITGAFYGYFFAVFGREAAGGHLAVERVLSSPYIDFLAGPRTYYPNAEAAGDPYRSRSLILSCLLHQKLWLDEMDDQPHLLSWKDSSYMQSVREATATTLRNISFTLTKGMGFWFYDFGPSGFNGGPRLTNHGVVGWWDDPYVMQMIGKFKKFAEQQYQKPYHSDADVLLVFDTRTFYYMGSDKTQTFLTHFADNWLPLAVFRSGAVHDVIHIDDLPLLDLTPYKVVIFVNTFVLNDKQKQFIHDHVEKDHRHVVWIYAPGYCNGTYLSDSLISDVVHMHIDKVKNEKPVTVQIDSSIVPGLQFSVWSTPVDPAFYVNDHEAKSIGSYLHTNLTAFAVRNFPDFTSWYVSLPFDDVRLVQYIFQKAGVHFYNKSGDDIFYAASGLLVIHTKTGGHQTISLKNGRVVNINLSPLSTNILDAETGEIVFSNF